MANYSAAGAGGLRSVLAATALPARTARELFFKLRAEPATQQLDLNYAAVLDNRQRAPFLLATNLCRGESAGVRREAFNDVPTISNGGCRGMHKVTVVPSPISLYTSSRKERPNNVCSRRRNSERAWRPGRRAKKTCSTSRDATPFPSSLTLISSHSPAARIPRRSRPAVADDCSPCCTAFSTRG